MLQKMGSVFHSANFRRFRDSPCEFGFIVQKNYGRFLGFDMIRIRTGKHIDKGSGTSNFILKTVRCCVAHHSQSCFLEF
jgi:hypothetical protein